MQSGIARESEIFHKLFKLDTRVRGIDQHKAAWFAGV